MRVLRVSVELCSRWARVLEAKGVTVQRCAPAGRWSGEGIAVHCVRLLGAEGPAVLRAQAVARDSGGVTN